MEKSARRLNYIKLSGHKVVFDSFVPILARKEGSKVSMPLCRPHARSRENILMSNAPLLLDQLVHLTAARDIEILEFSLLKTLHGMLHPEQVALFKLDKDHTPCFVMRYTKDGHSEVCLDAIELPSHVLEGARLAQRMHSPFRTTQQDGLTLSVYHLLGIKVLDTYLMVQTRRPPNRMEEHLQEGLLRIYQNYCVLLHESQRDQLTGLLNRKTFDESINKICKLELTEKTMEGGPERRRRHQDGKSRLFWLGMIDIDHFKRVNDTFGHLYGDEVLLLVARLIQQCFRADDLLFRFGGEEFVAIVCGSGKEGSRLAFERLRATIENYPFPQVGRVTISVGVVQITDDMVVPTLLDRADQALYYAKNSGRNQVFFYEDLVETGKIQKDSIQSGSIDFF